MIIENEPRFLDRWEAFNGLINQSVVDRFGISVNELVPAFLNLHKMIVDITMTEFGKVVFQSAIEYQTIKAIHPAANCRVPSQQISSNGCRKLSERCIIEPIHVVFEQGPEQHHDEHPL